MFSETTPSFEVKGQFPEAKVSPLYETADGRTEKVDKTYLVDLGADATKTYAEILRGMGFDDDAKAGVNAFEAKYNN